MNDMYYWFGFGNYILHRAFAVTQGDILWVDVYNFEA